MWHNVLGSLGVTLESLTNSQSLPPSPTSSTNIFSYLFSRDFPGFSKKDLKEPRITTLKHLLIICLYTASKVFCFILRSRHQIKLSLSFKTGSYSWYTAENSSSFSPGTLIDHSCLLCQQEFSALETPYKKVWWGKMTTVRYLQGLPAPEFFRIMFGTPLLELSCVGCLPK